MERQSIFKSPNRVRDLWARRDHLKVPVEFAARALWRTIQGHDNGLKRGPEEPLRAELYNISQLERHARALAGWHSAGGAGDDEAAPRRKARGGADRLLPRLKANEAVLRRAYDQLTDAVARGRRVTPAAEWLLDNYYLIEQQVRIARQHLPRGYSRELPQLLAGPSRGHPRIFDIALELITHVDGRIDASGLHAFVAAYQSVTRLRLGELWAIPIMLRLALIENLRRVAARVTAARDERERAGHWVDRMLEVAPRDRAGVVLVLAEMIRENPPLTNAFVSEFATRVHGQGSTLVFPMAWLEQRLAEQGQTIDQIYHQSSQNQAADQVSIGNTIGSLRFLGTTEWREFVESQSVVEHQLRGDPAGIYAAMEFATRDQYRHAVEKLARRCPLTEEGVARKAVELAAAHVARADAAEPERAGHVGYYLIDKGRPALERALAYRPKLRSRVKSLGRRVPVTFYVGSIVLITLAATAGLMLAGVRPAEFNPWTLAGTAAVLMLCASQLAVALVNWVATMLLPARVLPRMNFKKEGIPDACRTAVAVPALLTDAREIDELLEAMEVRYLANRDENLHFALLSDFRDAPAEQMPGDEALLARARAGIEALNRKYADQPGGRFFLFHRSRRQNPSEGVWMGWERKRGKIEEFNAALRGRPDGFSTLAGPVGYLRQVRYVITLDSDTQLPRDAARELVATMAHPLNRPVYDAKRGRVTEGYGILQPRVGVSMPSANRSPYARLYAGEPGVDPYTRAVSDIYQDAFGEGSFIGKGIYDIDSFARALGGRLPENRILSHDLLEGALARSAMVSDVVLYEDFPASFIADVSRRHRWTRGDWQIMPWLLRWVPQRRRGRDDSRGNPLSWLSQWKILDNLRRSLVPLALLGLLVEGWVIPGAAPAFMGAVVALLFTPTLLAGTLELSRRPEDLPFRHHGRQVLISLRRQLAQLAFELACLPFNAWVSLDAIVRTLFRMAITRRKLLQWRPARDAQRAAQFGLGGFYLVMAAAPVIALGVAAGLAWFNPRTLAFAAPVLALWLVSPAMAWGLSQPLAPREERLNAGDTIFLRTLARRTWRYFEEFVTAADNDLPPDNFQELPPRGLAHRTSPTNIGMALLSNLGAHDFGFVTAGEVVRRTTRTFATMGNLARHRGHFFNWYDTRTLKALPPLYISTVDSGNLIGHLLTLACGLEEMQRARIVRGADWDGVGTTVEVIAEVLQQRPTPGRRKGPPPPPQTAALLGQLREILRREHANLSGASQGYDRLLAAIGELKAAVDPDPASELGWWTLALERQCREAAGELSYLAPWAAVLARGQPSWWVGLGTGGDQHLALRDALAKLEAIPTLAELSRVEETILPAIAAALAEPAERVQSENDRALPAEAREWLAAVREALIDGGSRAAERMRELRDLAMRCREFADADFDFLHDADLHLLTTGFNLTDHRCDAGSYDLLASEARLATFVAIALDKLPQESWFYMGRQLTLSGGTVALLSWSGSMFEYLMPLLVMPTYERTVLDETCRAIVRRQIAYGREAGVPWGVSESGYAKLNGDFDYMYRAFGVPGLGFKRGLADDLVIAPYASALALMVAPGEACANLRRLAREDRMGAYGFYEAVDYTPARRPPGEGSVTVRSYMVHHAGMTLLSLVSALLGRPMQRRFMADPAMQATDLLLQERVPRTQPVHPRRDDVAESFPGSAEGEASYRVFHTAQTPSPQVHLLSNGRYHVAVTAAGGGYSRWRDLAITRWVEDPTRDCFGSFCYIRDAESGQAWSAAHQPTLRRAEKYEAIFSEARAEFRRRDGDIESHLEISVSPEDDIELRRLSVTNHGRHARTLEFTSYAEVALAPPAADAAHPAFNKLFVQTEILAQRQAILCTRRPRSAGEAVPWMFHLLTLEGKTTGPATYETDRAKFLGRGGSTADPAAMRHATLSQSQGAVLDPIVSVRQTVVVGPDETVRVHIVTGASGTREGALGLVERYHDRNLADRVIGLAWTHSQVFLRQLDATEADAQLFGRLAGNLLYANPNLRAPASTLQRNRRGQSGLWGYGISGDLPIVLLRVANMAEIGLVRQLAKAHAYWRMKGLIADLVIWNEDLSGYRQEMQEQIMSAISSDPGAKLLDRPGGVFVRRIDQMSEEDKVLMQAVARVVISDADGPLVQQLERRPIAAIPVPRFIPGDRRFAALPVAAEVPPRDLSLFNGLGGFTRDGREYVVITSPGLPTPAPWVNVIANPWFGSVVSESGGAYTWCENAHSHRLTPWNNDPVGDFAGEAFYLRDEETGRFWSPTPLPARGPMPYVTRHGFGYSAFEYNEDGIFSEMTTFVATDAPAKFVVLKLRNNSGRPRTVSVTAVFDLVLGEHRPGSAPHVVTEIDPRTGALMARNTFNTDFASRVMFLASSEANSALCGDRTEVIGRNGKPANPACMTRARLSGRVGAGLDPCAAMQSTIDLPEHQEREIAFVLGSGRDLADAQHLVSRFRGVGPAHSALEGVWHYWNHTLGAVNVETPDNAVNFLANGWLLYQVLASRVWGRSGFYQSGGAFGFRDQLQDTMALIHAEPVLLREQLLKAAARQFPQGDVLHWWHPPQGRGVRTRISDDYLWLPYAACRYVAAVGDTGVLDEPVHFIDGRPLNADQESSYDLYPVAELTAPLYDHCVRAIRHGLRFGEHGLPLFGSGDWNDGMNLVGEHGKGESVWLAMFLFDVLTRFGPLARARGDAEFADFCANEAQTLQKNIELHTWDGQWYRRGYFDNGLPLGSASSPECQIDSLPQSWAVLSHCGEPGRTREALESLDRRLVRRDLKLIQLFDPAFDKSDLNPGYIKGYVPGVRENGGQYTHAAVWAAMAFAASGDRDRAWELFSLINPLRHGDTPAGMRTYCVEPYVVAADVYTNPQHAGRGGWTWYTGSAGWMYRLITESLLGITLEVDTLRFTPCVPREWQQYKVHYRFRETVYHINFRVAGPGQTVLRISEHGEALPGNTLRLVDDRQPHEVEVEIG